MLFKSDHTRRKVTLVAGFLFFIGMSQSLLTSLMASSPDSTTAQARVSQTSEQIDMEQGYTIVLEREPENQTALKGLIDTRLAKENWRGVLDPLNRLIALNPKDESLQTLRQMIEEKMAVSDEISEPSNNTIDHP